MDSVHFTGSKPHDFWSWLLAGNISIIFRAAFYIWWVVRFAANVFVAWHVTVSMYAKWGLLPFLLGVGDVVSFLPIAITLLYGWMPYFIYEYTRREGSGAISNALLNLGGVVMAEYGFSVVSSVITLIVE